MLILKCSSTKSNFVFGLCATHSMCQGTIERKQNNTHKKKHGQVIMWSFVTKNWTHTTKDLIWIFQNFITNCCTNVLYVKNNVPNYIA